jgi:hypothetical protein
MPRLITQKRHRLVHKITGWPRIGFVAEAFEDAKFIHVIRDGRAVANSMLNVDFWDGWQGPDKWLYGSLPERYREVWEKYDRSFVALAGLQWKMLMDAADEAVAKLDPEKVLTIRYEDMCPDAIPTFKKVAQFCELEWDDDFEKRLKKYPMKNTNEKYKKDLTPQQQNELESVLADYLEKYGYEI